MKSKPKKKRTHKPLALRPYKMTTLSGVPGSGGAIHVVNVRSVSDAIQFLRAGLPVGAVGDAGALMIWRDKAGLWHCEFYQHQQNVNEFIAKYLAGVCEWLKEWWPEMRR